MAFVAGQTYTARAVFERPSSDLIPFFYLRAVTVASAYVFVRTSDMSVHLTAGPNVVSSEIAALPGGRWIVKLVFTAASSGTAAVRVGLADFVTLGAYTGSVRGIIVSGREVALGNVPITSPIVYGTRSADNVTVPNLAATGFNASESTLYVDAESPVTANTKHHISLSGGSAANVLAIYALNNNIGMVALTAGVTQAQVETAVTGTRSRSAFAYKVNDFAMSANSGAVVKDTSGTVPTVSVMHLGDRADGNRKMNGRIYQAAIIPRRISDAALQNVTKL